MVSMRVSLFSCIVFLSVATLHDCNETKQVTHDAQKDTEHSTDSEAAEVTCECLTPGRGTFRQNGYVCSDGSMSACEVHHECHATTKFSAKTARQEACREPNMAIPKPLALVEDADAKHRRLRMTQWHAEE